MNRKHSFKRKFIQLLSALIYNAHFKGFGETAIYKGATKGVCVPGLNCYSCPGAVAACPLGSLQNALSGAGNRIPMYIPGLLLLFGLLLGRVVCGFLCPFGLLQELLYKIPSPKLSKNSITKRLCSLKYLILVVLVFVFPLFSGLVTGLPLPGFCKYICPAGTLEGGLPLVLGRTELRSAAGWLFSWKVLLLAAFLIAMIPVYRVFCRFICPLGAIYALFSRISILGLETDENRCNGCGRCVRTCKMDIHRPGDAECIQCGECKESCVNGAIVSKFKIK